MLIEGPPGNLDEGMKSVDYSHYIGLGRSRLVLAIRIQKKRERYWSMITSGNGWA